ncbi:MAG: hypothetical protein ABI680_04275 [Chthoniobacteraceae bacterium]
MIDLPAKEESEFPPGTPAPADLVARASALVRTHPECFWFWHPDAQVDDLKGVRLVVETLRQYGDHEAWRKAQALHRCLSQNSKRAS